MNASQIFVLTLQHVTMLLVHSNANVILDSVMMVKCNDADKCLTFGPDCNLEHEKCTNTF